MTRAMPVRSVKLAIYSDLLFIVLTGYGVSSLLFQDSPHLGGLVFLSVVLGVFVQDVIRATVLLRTKGVRVL